MVRQDEAARGPNRLPSVQVLSPSKASEGQWVVGGGSVPGFLSTWAVPRDFAQPVAFRTTRAACQSTDALHSAETRELPRRRWLVCLGEVR